MSALLEHDAVANAHPRYVTPAGDRRERSVPCRRCGRSTLALCPTICVRCTPISDAPPACGASDAGDVVDPLTPGSDVAGHAANRNAPVAADTAPGQ